MELEYHEDDRRQMAAFLEDAERRGAHAIAARVRAELARREAEANGKGERATARGN